MPLIVPGRRVLLACVALVAGLSAPAAYWMIKAKPRAGAYIDALALDGDFAVTLRREETEGRAFVELIGLDEGLRWQALIPSYQVGAGAIGVAASRHVITVRFPRDGRTQLFGFAASSAQKLGTIILGEELRGEPDGHAAPALASLSGGTESFEVVEPDGGPTRIAAISLLRGETAWERDLPGAGVEALWLTRDEVIVEQPGALVRIARAYGEVRSTPASTVCVIGDRVWTEAELGLDAGERFTGLCGQRGAALVIGVDGPGGAALRIGDRRIALGDGWLGTDAYLRQRGSAPTAAPLSGELGRIVPVLVAGPGGGRVIGVDLDAARIVWESAREPGLGDVALIDGGDAVLWRAGDELVSIDPTTGARRSVRTPDARPLWPHHVAGGTVWVIGDRGLAALDVTTLEPRGIWRSPPVIER